jgi:hypothetical protein
MFKANTRFKDLEDKGHIYNAGDPYPREGYEPTKVRIKNLSSKNNKEKKPVITQVVKEKAIKAEKEL